MKVRMAESFETVHTHTHTHTHTQAVLNNIINKAKKIKTNAVVLGCCT